MKNYLYLLLLMFPLCYSCSPSSVQSETDSEANSDRNMFGVGIPRGLTNTSDGLEPGYVMFCISNSASTYLMDRQGIVVHEWKGNYRVMGAYLGDDGSLYQNASDVDFPVFAGGGETGRLQKLSWDSKILWDFEYANEEYHAHHDFAVMPNGNILAIAWEARSKEEAIALGRDPEKIPDAGFWPDKIVELKPTDKHHADVVWEWHSWDHIIQDFDPTLPNYGDPSLHPELLDINVSRPLPPPITQDSMDRLHAMGRVRRNTTIHNRGSDIYHFNAINYNAELDQIAFSSPSLSEIFIIDHSTTTEEAAGHSGGRWGKGGDFLYRWGNPQNYGRGDSTDQMLFGQHDIRWVENGYPGAGNLTVFNNDIPGGPDSMDYSSVYEIKPPLDQSGNYIIEDNLAFGPVEPSWKYIAPDTLSFYSSFISGAHRMPNGNTFINEGAKGRFFEVTPDGDIVWEYLNNFRGEIRRPNGDPIDPMPMVHSQFRSTFIPESHPGIQGKELKPLDPQPKPFIIPKVSSEEPES